MDSNNATREMPLISVIIATYNRENFVVEAIQSALDQTYPNIEVIVVDDGSTDDTRALISRMFGDNPVVSYYYQDNNKRASAFNHGLSYARGEYVAIVDSDNRWLPKRLELGYRALLENPGFDIAYGDNILIDEQGTEISRENMRRYSGLITKHLLRDNCVSINTALVPRRCFEEMGPMDISRKRADDYELWLRFSTAYKFLYVPEFMAEYRVMEDQISSDKTRRFEANWQIISDFRAKYPNAVSTAEFESGFSVFFIRKARYLASQGSRLKAMRVWLCAFRLKPFAKPTWRGLAAVLLK